jgi:hypothetical protein
MTIKVEYDLNQVALDRQQVAATTALPFTSCKPACRLSTRQLCADKMPNFIAAR